MTDEQLLLVLKCVFYQTVITILLVLTATSILSVTQVRIGDRITTELLSLRLEVAELHKGK